MPKNLDYFEHMMRKAVAAVNTGNEAAAVESFVAIGSQLLYDINRIADAMQIISGEKKPSPFRATFEEKP